MPAPSFLSACLTPMSNPTTARITINEVVWLAQKKKKREHTPPRPRKGGGLSEFLEEQRSTFTPDVHIELSSNREAVVEGCKGVLEYTPERVRLSCGSKVVRFIGDALELRCVTDSTAVVTGRILLVEFQT